MSATPSILLPLTPAALIRSIGLLGVVLAWELAASPSWGKALSDFQCELRFFMSGILVRLLRRYASLLKFCYNLLERDDLFAKFCCELLVLFGVVHILWYGSQLMTGVRDEQAKTPAHP